jgi:hypothetical protein
MREPSTPATLEERIAALSARREAVRARVRKRERADDLRRKVLVGALVLARWPEGRMPEEWRRALGAYLIRPRDRRLFGLAERDGTNRDRNRESDAGTG